MKFYFSVFLLLVIHLSAIGEDKPDLKVIHSIKEEAFQNSKVMDHLFYLTDVNGPRLSGSPEYQAAAEWAVKQLKSWGISNSQLEPWGQFGRSWSLRRFNAHLIQPAYVPLQAFPNAWSPSTSGTVRGNIIYAPLVQTWEEESAIREDPTKLLERVQEYAAKYRGQFRGKIVLVEPTRSLKLLTDPAFERFSEKDLSEMAESPAPFAAPDYQWPILTLPEDPKKREELMDSLPLEVESDLWERQQRSWDQFNDFLQKEGALAMFVVSRRGFGGTLYAQEGSSWHSDAALGPPSIVLEPEQYGRMVRLFEKKIPVEVELELQVEMPEKPVDGFNVIAEIPGTKKKDEIVMAGAHLDSWHSGTGATDNAAGCSVVLEAMRILKTLNLQHQRTIRLGLWGGEEQGLYGSRAYVQKHFADPVTMELRPEHSKFSGYFNLDNGTGKIRGVYLQGNDMMRPVFESWIAPFRDTGVTTLTIRNTSGTDHLSFDAVGLPGFQFIQDRLEYSTRTHHSNIDSYDHIQSSDLMQASAIIASVLYQAANKDELLPRKTLPKPLPPKTKFK